ncbi:hypothetical protein [Arsenicicoccus sp. oral taxon 190]|uniref:hypothetical protein n=1 Tax=Arsenicicoccus sp. oral taxon 190 TaxID=1658671 RepID=UPI000679EA45|nr:hypothetical protein [Arsenicicoccus sp. oral taxon 190]AKT51257.1 hypothetical protein ADJ73_07915 [Arsenicicoccus sp. oral taxon 190]
MDKRDRRWIDEMVVELRLQDIKGGVIGDAVTSVETHLAESGESAQETFGDPREYARSLTFTEAQRERMAPADWAMAIGPSLVGLAGLTLSTAAVRAYRLGTDVAVSVGELATLVLLVGVVMLVARRLRPILERPFVGVLAITVAVAVMAATAVLLREPAVHLPRALAAAVAVALLVGGAIVAQRVSPRLTDPVIDPRDGRDRYGSPRGEAAGRALAGASGWLILLVAVLLGLLTWFTA